MFLDFKSPKYLKEMYHKKKKKIFDLPLLISVEIVVYIFTVFLFSVSLDIFSLLLFPV